MGRLAVCKCSTILNLPFVYPSMSLFIAAIHSYQYGIYQLQNMDVIFETSLLIFPATCVCDIPWPVGREVNTRTKHVHVAWMDSY